MPNGFMVGTETRRWQIQYAKLHQEQASPRENPQVSTDKKSTDVSSAVLKEAQKK